MNIVLFGASGFIGRRVAQLLRERGHQLRTPGSREINFLQPNPNRLPELFAGQDAVVNAVGVMSRHAQVLEAVHHHTPRLLAQHAQQAGVKRWVQLSALGADAADNVCFTGSKGRGDAAVRDSGLSVAVARPSVVYGRGGASCELFIKLARLPVLVLPDGGGFLLQPVHVNDVAAALARLCESDDTDTFTLTGGSRLTLAEYLNTLRRTLHGKPAAAVWTLPLPLLRPVLPTAKYLSNGMLSPDSITLLQRGSTGNNQAFAALLGREPLAAEAFARQD